MQVIWSVNMCINMYKYYMEMSDSVHHWAIDTS